MPLALYRYRARIWLASSLLRSSSRCCDWLDNIAAAACLAKFCREAPSPDTSVDSFAFAAGGSSDGRLHLLHFTSGVLVQLAQWTFQHVLHGA